RLTTYRLTVRNPGTIPATHVTLIDELPKEIAFVSASGGGKFERDTILFDGVRGNGVRWNVGTLNPAEARTVQLVVRALKPTLRPYRNVCTASGDRDLRVQATAETTFRVARGLTLLLEKSSDPVEEGERLSLAV